METHCLKGIKRNLLLRYCARKGQCNELRTNTDEKNGETVENGET